MFDFFITRLQQKEKLIERIIALWILKYLILRAFDLISIANRKMLISYLQNLVYDTDVEVRFSKLLTEDALRPL